MAVFFRLTKKAAAFLVNSLRALLRTRYARTLALCEVFSGAYTPLRKTDKPLFRRRAAKLYEVFNNLQKDRLLAVFLHIGEIILPLF